MAEHKVDTKVLANSLAKELGYKNLDDFKLALEQRTPKSLKGRLESGEGFGSAIANTISHKTETLKENLSVSGIKKKTKGAAERVYKEFFKGDDIFSAYMRGRINKQSKVEEVDKDESSRGGGAIGKDANALLKIIAKNCISLHMMSRDMNVFRQNIQELTKLENKNKKSKNKPADKADAWFDKEDAREAKLEADRQKYTKEKPSAEASSTTPTPEASGGSGGILGSIMSMLSDGLMSGFKMLLNPMTILKMLGKVFLIGALFISLFKGVTAAFDKWQETGSIKEAIIAGLGAIVDFLTFGFFGEDSIRSLFGAVEEFIGPIVDTFSSVFNTVKDWIANTIGVPEIKLGSLTIYNPIPGSKDWVIDLPTIGPYYPFKSNPRSTEKQVTKPVGNTKSSEADKKQEAAKKAEAAKKTEPSKAKDSYNELMTANSDLKKLQGDYDKEYAAAKTDEERQAINTKYSKLFDEKKNKIKKLQGVPGVKELLGNQKLNLDVGVKSTKPSQLPTSAAGDMPSGLAGQLSELDKTQSDARTELEKNVGADSTEMKVLVAQQQKDRADLIAKFSPNTTASAVTPSKDIAPSSGITGASPSSVTSDIPSGSVNVPAPQSTGSVSGTSTAASSSQVSSSSPKQQTPAPITSGASISTSSAEVAEARRMEFSNDAGGIINNPTTNNTKGSTGKDSSRIGEVYDTEFAEYYATT